MKKGYKLLLLFFLAFFSWQVNIDAKSDPKTLGDLRENYRELVRKQEEYNRLSAEKKKENELKEAAIKQAEKDIHQAEEDQIEAQTAIDESNKEIEKLTKEANSVLLYLQQVQGENAYVEYVSGSETMTDLITRIAALEQVSLHIQQTMENLEKEIKKNEELKIALQEKTERLNAQNIEYRKVIEANTLKIDEYNRFALDINTQVKVVKSNLDMYEKLCPQYAKSSDDSVLLTDCSNTPVNAGWLKPVTHGIILSTLGPRWGSFHNALDIAGPSPYEGTPVYAAAAGVVSGMVSRYSCGGNMLFIDVVVGGKKYTTYYYHLLSFNVKMGDIVTQDTIIGYVGGYSTSTSHGGYDNCSTGAHLHFGVANGFYNGYSPQSTAIVPPGFPNRYGWSFSSRTQMG